MSAAAERVEQILARVEAATEGPWESSCWDSGHSHFEMSCTVVTQDAGDHIADLNGLVRLGNELRAQDDGRHDAEFIAHARDDVPWLLARLADQATTIAEQAATIQRVRALIPPNPELIEAGYAVPATDLLAALGSQRTEGQG